MPITDAELDRRLTALREQGYPLTVSREDAEAIVECIDRIRIAVPDDDRPFIRADYALVTSAINHPTNPDGSGASNEWKAGPP